MSWEAQGAVWKLPVKITASEKLLLLALANEADVDGEIAGKARRSQRWLAQQCRWNRAETVRLTLKSLEQKGLLAITQSGTGRRQATYKLPFVGAFNALIEGAEKPPLRPAEGADIPPPAPPQNRPPSSLLLSLEEQPFARGHVDDWFERVFWPKYPVKNRRDVALGILRSKAKTRADLEQIAAGLEHWIAAELAARASSKWFQTWPNPNTWLAQARWRDRFDVPRETSRDESKCYRCGSEAVGVFGGKPHCRAHGAVFQSEEQLPAKRATL